MANFDDQVMGLTGLTISGSSTAPSQTELTQFLTDGAKEIINILPPKLKEKCMKITNLYIGNTNTTFDLDDAGEVTYVTRENANSGYYTPCRKIPSMFGDLTNDSGNIIHYATSTDPVYWVESNSLGVATLFVKPTPDANQPAKVYHIAYPSVAYNGDGTIANFPNEAEYLVVLYAACKSLQSALGGFGISTFSLSAAAPVDTPALPNISGGSVGDITIDALPSAPDYTTPTTTISGVAWATEYPSRISAITTALGKIETAVTQASTAAGKFIAADSDSIFGDEDTFLTDASQLARVKDALDNAEKIIDDGANSPTGNAAGDAATYLYTEEDTELLQGALGIASSEISRAQIHLSEWTAIGDMRVKEIQAALSEAKGYEGEVQALLSSTPIKIQEYQARVQDALNVFNEGNVVYQAAVQRNLEQARINMQDAQKEADMTLQASIQDYTLELQRVSASVSKYQALVQQEVQTYQQEVAEKQAEYTWMTQQYNMIKQDYVQGISSLGMAKGQMAGSEAK